MHCLASMYTTSYPFLARFLGAEKDNDMMIARLIAKKSAVAAKQSWGINAK